MQIDSVSLRFLRIPFKHAFEHALKHSAPELLMTLDAAGHHDARQLPDLVRACRTRNSGVTIGSRTV